MPLTAGDKCPQCKEGLLEKSEDGLQCTKCDFSMELAEVVAANEKAETETEDYTWRSCSVKVRIETPGEGEDFLRGLILAKQNNNSPLFEHLIDAVNAVLEPWRAAQLQEQMKARGY